jgi:hypothetical protein
MSWSKRLGLAAVGLILVAAGWWALGQWRATVIERQRERAFAAVTKLIGSEHWSDARGALRAFWQDFGSSLPADEAVAWRRLDITLSLRSGDLARLVWLYDVVPGLVLGDEDASLLVARVFNASGQAAKAAAVVQAWANRQGQPGRWVVLRADQLISDGQGEEARGLLATHTFTGDAEVARRLRLAILAANPRAAWAELNAAVKENPRHSDVRSMRAQLLERAGAVDQARVEYVAALVADPHDIVRRDQLAEFYRRHGVGTQADQTWRDGLAPTAPDFLWLRTSLWRRLWGPVAADALPAAPPGRWQALISHLASVPPDRFWVEPMAMNPAERRQIEARPEVAWLGLLEQLRTGDESGARETLTTQARPLAAWDAKAAATLRAVIRWRANELAPADGFLPVAVTGAAEHILIEQLRLWPAKGLPAETAALLRGDAAWPALMLAAGWPQAALTMAGSSLQKPDPAMPGWYHYGLAVALRELQGGASARAYVTAVPATPELRLLAAEIAWASGEPEATEQMTALAKEPGPAGFKAAWLLATAAAERSEVAVARHWIESRTDLAASALGQALLARLALAENKLEEARRIYTALGPSSLEAGMFLAREAYARNDWASARALTLALLTNFPDEIELRANLERIEKAAEAAR